MSRSDYKLITGLSYWEVKVMVAEWQAKKSANLVTAAQVCVFTIFFHVWNQRIYSAYGVLTIVNVAPLDIFKEKLRKCVATENQKLVLGRRAIPSRLCGDTTELSPRIPLDSTEREIEFNLNWHQVATLRHEKLWLMMPLWKVVRKWTKGEKEPSLQYEYIKTFCALVPPLKTAGALIYFFSPLPLKHSESATAYCIASGTHDENVGSHAKDWLTECRSSNITRVRNTQVTCRTLKRR